MSEENNLNNQVEINNMMDDYYSNEQYFMDISEAKGINNTISASLNKYMKAINKVMSMVNVTKILNLEIPCNSRYGGNYCVVLSNQGLRARHITENWITQTDDLSVSDFGKTFNLALKVIFNHPNISKIQKNKITPLQKIDVSFLNDISTNETVVIENVRRINEDMTIGTEPVTMPGFYSYQSRYSQMSVFTLLSMRTQISKELNDYLVERRSIITMMAEKLKEVEELFPIIFLFGDN